MADDRHVSSNNGEAVRNEDHLPQENGHSDGSLADFVTRNYEEQRAARQQRGPVDGDAAVDEDRTAKFFQRALSESQRMNAEVQRSEQRQNQLYSELGQENIHAWTMEHASEVTIPELSRMDTS